MQKRVKGNSPAGPRSDEVNKPPKTERKVQVTLSPCRWKADHSWQMKLEQMQACSGRSSSRRRNYFGARKGHEKGQGPFERSHPSWAKPRGSLGNYCSISVFVFGCPTTLQLNCLPKKRNWGKKAPQGLVGYQVLAGCIPVSCRRKAEPCTPTISSEHFYHAI